jgi:hypothetical protein
MVETFAACFHRKVARFIGEGAGIGAAITRRMLTEALA